MGYGTPAHMAAIAERGPCPLHRKTFEPLRSILKLKKRPRGGETRAAAG